MNIDSLGKLIGVDLTKHHDECTVFNAAVVSIVCHYWKNYGMYLTDPSIKPTIPAFILSENIKINANRFYFDVAYTTVDFSGVDHILYAIETSLQEKPGIKDITIQGTRIIVTGNNSKYFSLSFFELSERFDSELNASVKSWMMHTTES